MARFGTNFDDVNGSFGGQAALPEPGTQDFEITRVTDGVQKPGTANAGSPFFMVQCTQMSGEAPGTRSMSQFLGLGTKPWVNGSCQKDQLKGFFEGVGRGDLLHMDGDSSELIGTTFRARVYHTTDKEGKTEARLADLEPLSHAQGMASNAPSNYTQGDVAGQAQAQAPVQTTAPMQTQAQPQQVQTPAAPSIPAPAHAARRRSR